MILKSIQNKSRASAYRYLILLLLLSVFTLESCQQQGEVNPSLAKETNSNPNWVVDQAYLKENNLTMEEFENQFKQDMQELTTTLESEAKHPKAESFDLNQPSFDAFKQSFQGILTDMVINRNEWFAFRINTSPAELDFGMKLSKLSAGVRNLPGLTWVKISGSNNKTRSNLYVRKFRFHTIESIEPRRIRIILSASAELRYHKKVLGAFRKIATAKGNANFNFDLTFDTETGEIILDNSRFANISLEVKSPLLYFINPLIGYIVNNLNIRIRSRNVDFSRTVQFNFLRNNLVQLDNISRTNINNCGDYVLFNFDINLPNLVDVILAAIGNRRIGRFPSCNSGGGGGGPSGGGGEVPIFAEDSPVFAGFQ